MRAARERCNHNDEYQVAQSHKVCSCLANAAHHWRRASDVQHETETESRRPVDEPGYAFSGAFRLARQYPTSATTTPSPATHAVIGLRGSRPHDDNHRKTPAAAAPNSPTPKQPGRLMRGRRRTEKQPETSISAKPIKKSHRLPMHIRLRATANKPRLTASLVLEFSMAFIMHNDGTHSRRAPAVQYETAASSRRRVQ
jgi:hypothetical protein